MASDKSLWGLELNGSVRYHDADEPIFVQLQYGVMFPFGGFNAQVQNGTAVQRLDAKAAQSIQAQIGVRF